MPTVLQAAKATKTSEGVKKCSKVKKYLSLIKN
jgi:hypothetical protein